MFTGIIQNQAEVMKKISLGGQTHFSFRFTQKEKRALTVGESIAVNGVCLTAVTITPRGFEADAVRETLRSTALTDLKAGDRVNTERALRLGDPLGGHFVTGHVDGVGYLTAIQKVRKNLLCSIWFPPELKPFMAVKGSVVVDGISLTIQSLSGNTLSVAIVPHTWKVTNLSSRKLGDRVNLEADLVARYLKRLQETIKSSGKKVRRPITLKTLRKQGF